jgi:hypothetical protein
MALLAVISTTVYEVYSRSQASGKDRASIYLRGMYRNLGID